VAASKGPIRFLSFSGPEGTGCLAESWALLRRGPLNELFSSCKLKQLFAC
jgi:hypothetical protein